MNKVGEFGKVILETTITRVGGCSIFNGPARVIKTAAKTSKATGTVAQKMRLTLQSLLG